MKMNNRVKKLAVGLIVVGSIIVSGVVINKAAVHLSRESYIAGFVNGADIVLAQMTGGQLRVDPEKARAAAEKELDSLDKK